MIHPLIVLLSILLSSSATTVLVDSGGAANRAALTSLSNNDASGVVAILTSRGMKNPFDSIVDGDENGGVSLSISEDENNNILLLCPGATLSGGERRNNDDPLSMGVGSSAVSSVADSVIVTGVTRGDVQVGLGNTRHGRTLAGIFDAKLKMEEGEEKVTKLVIVVASEVGEDDEESVTSDILDIFSAVATTHPSSSSMEDLYEIEVVSEGDDLSSVISTTPSNSKTSVSSTAESILEAYTEILHSSRGTLEAPGVASALSVVDVSFGKYSKAARVKISSWRSRVKRGLIVDGFGSQAEDLLKKTMAGYDRDTMVTAGLAPVSSHRLQIRAQLRGYLQENLSDLFDSQVENLSKSSIKKFESKLISKMDQQDVGSTSFYTQNADAIQVASDQFSATVSALEVPTLNLFTTPLIDPFISLLQDTLSTITRSPAARLKALQKVSLAANKDNNPTERSFDIGMDLVAMIRPDGFGSLQGFAGYQLGGNNIIVGVHNDADAPDVISQFGGVRPPFLRVQPKFKFDIEL